MTVPDLRSRARGAEMMDGDDVAPSDYAACMADLAQVNTVTLARRPTLAFISQAIAHLPLNPTILDVGFGAGDMLRAIATMLHRRGIPARLIGIDLNPRSEGAARGLTPTNDAAMAAIEWRTGDAFALGPADRPDIVISSLVTHHMDDAEIVRFLAWMEATARHGWFVNDLHRHRIAYWGITTMARIARWHRFVRHDGPLSVARSFRRADWQALLAQAGVSARARVRWRFPFRYCVERRAW